MAEPAWGTIAGMSRPATSRAETKRSGESAAKLPALLNGLAVLRSFTAAEPLLGVTEISAKVGLHKSSVSRILATLEAADLVERDAVSRRFRLGLGVIELAGPILADLDVRRVAYPLLADLARRTGETAALMVWSRGAAVCVEQVASPQEVKHSTAIGTRYASAASASVQVLACAQPIADIRRQIDTGVLTGPGLGTTEEYLATLAAVRSSRVAINYGQTSVDEVGIAAAVEDHRGAWVAAVLLSAPRFRVSAEHSEALAEEVLRCAEEISQRLGGAQASA